MYLNFLYQSWEKFYDKQSLMFLLKSTATPTLCLGILKTVDGDSSFQLHLRGKKERETHYNSVKQNLMGTK